MIYKIKELWEEKGFEILFGLCIAFIIIYGLYRLITKKRGTYSKSYYYNKPNSNHESVYESPKKQIVKESKGEVECRRVLNKIFNKPFFKARPDFLNNPVTGGQFNLELDCYEPSLNLAVEYNGIQHYQYNKFFHRNKEHFLNQKYRDDMKRRICKDRGIILIEVPYTVKIADIENYLVNKLKIFGILK
jgi:hypothetical protein